VSNSTPQNLKPTTISKLNTVLQCFLIVGAAARAAGLVPPVLEPDSVEVLWNALVLTTGVTTLWSWAVRNVQGWGTHGGLRWAGRSAFFASPAEWTRRRGYWVVGVAGRIISTTSSTATATGRRAWHSLRRQRQERPGDW
jgi:hypothetical protein